MLIIVNRVILALSVCSTRRSSSGCSVKMSGYDHQKLDNIIVAYALCCHIVDHDMHVVFPGFMLPPCRIIVQDRLQRSIGSTLPERSRWV